MNKANAVVFGSKPWCFGRSRLFRWGRGGVNLSALLAHQLGGDEDASRRIRVAGVEGAVLSDRERPGDRCIGGAWPQCDKGLDKISVVSSRSERQGVASIIIAHAQAAARGKGRDAGGVVVLGGEHKGCPAIERQ